jgi:hypothetical protein
MKNTYEQPSFVQACDRAILFSTAQHRHYVVQETAAGTYTCLPLTIPAPDNCLIFIGNVCEDHNHGKVVRTGIFTPTGFSCVWSET